MILIFFTLLINYAKVLIWKKNESTKYQVQSIKTVFKTRIY